MLHTAFGIRVNCTLNLCLKPSRAYHFSMEVTYPNKRTKGWRVTFSFSFFFLNFLKISRQMVTWHYRITEVCLRTNEKNFPRESLSIAPWSAPWGPAHPLLCLSLHPLKHTHTCHNSHLTPCFLYTVGEWSHFTLHLAIKIRERGSEKERDTLTVVWRTHTCHVPHPWNMWHTHVRRMCQDCGVESNDRYGIN